MRIPNAREVRLIEVEFCTGAGTEEEPYRAAKAYFWPNGELLYCDDPMAPLGKTELLIGPREERK